MSGRVLVVDDSATIRRVVCDILERRGYDVIVAVDGEQALFLANAATLDLALVDFVMPKMNGFEFCRAMRGSSALSQTPIILMTAKPDRFREKFVEQTGAVDALAKPFDAAALVLSVENALRRVREGRAEPAPPVADVFVEPEKTVPPPPDDAESEPHSDGDSPTTRMRVAGLLVVKIAEHLHGVGGLSDDELLGELALRIPPTIARDIVASVREAEGSLVFSGVLPIIPLSSVLQTVRAENLSGILHLSRPGTEITVSCRDGMVDLVEATGASAEFRLGRYLVEDAVLTRSELEQVLAASQDDDGSRRRRKPLGDRLLDSGLLTQEALARALMRQSCELIYDVLRWRRGRFEFRKERARHNAMRARLGLSVASLVVEGFRRVDEWRHLESIIGSLDTVLVRDADFGRKLDLAALPQLDRDLLMLVDGDRSIREILHASTLSSFDASRVLAQFLSAHLVQRRGA
jgi:CheY-like chemotaxis protein